MVKGNFGFVYQIGRVDGEGDVYVGSTFDLGKRKNCHKTSCMNEKDKAYNYRVYQTIRDNGGWYNYAVTVLETVPISEKISNLENKYALQRRERFHVEEIKPKLNRCVPMRTIDDGNKCEHNKRRNQCKECGGSQICDHSRRKDNCKDCKGSQLCEHAKQKGWCKDCDLERYEKRMELQRTRRAAQKAAKTQAA